MESYSSNNLASAIGFVPEIILGLFNNIFIISVIFFDFHKKKHMSSSNKILVCIGMSNVTYAILLSAGLLNEFIGLHASSTSALSSLYIILFLYSISSCAWLSAGLGAFYLVKISQSGLFSWVKLHISCIVPWLLLALEVLSFVTSFFCSFLIISPQDSSGNITGSPPPVMRVIAENRSGFISAAHLVTFLPFMIIFISSVCIVWTLRQHSQKMERSMGTVENGRLTPYERVVRRMTHFLFFYVIFYTLMLIFCFAIMIHIQFEFWVVVLLMSSFNPLQSIFLICGDSRLKDAWKKMSHYDEIIKFLSRSNEEMVR